MKQLLSLALVAAALLCPPARAQDTGPLSEEEFKRLHQLRPEEGPPLRGSTLELEGDRVYLSLPQGEGPFPAVVVIQEWWGLNDHIRRWADRLAGEGYAALAVDLYGGQVATTPDRAMELMKGLEEARTLARLRAAVAFLRQDPRVKATKVGSIGWCLGGAWSLRLALADPDLSACVLYYGRLVSDVAQLRAIKAPICAIFGTRDGSIPAEAVQAFEDGLTAAGVTHEVHRYDAEHAFANPSGPRYASAEAAQAWEKARAFLARHLKD